jgi:hypothetical protein
MLNAAGILTAVLVSPWGTSPCMQLHPSSANIYPICGLYAALECDPKMFPFSEDEALNSTRQFAACTNGVRTKTLISGLFKVR